MDAPRKPNYRVLEKGGRLVVEPTGKPPSPPRRITLPRIAPRELFIRAGIALLKRHHSFDETPDGHAIMMGSQLQDYLRLEARSSDLFYVSTFQQALLGWKGPAALAVVAFYGLCVWFLPSTNVYVGLLVIFLMVLPAAVAGKLLNDRIEAIQFQIFDEDPEATESPADPD